MKGDGDRDMLLAMLNAKSSEDQVSFLVFHTQCQPAYHVVNHCPLLFVASRVTCDIASDYA